MTRTEVLTRLNQIDEEMYRSGVDQGHPLRAALKEAARLLRLKDSDDLTEDQT